MPDERAPFRHTEDVEKTQKERAADGSWEEERKK